MLGDSYIPGALALGYSLKEHKTKYPTVIMVTPDVSLSSKNLLSQIFDRVVEVPYLSHPTRQFTSDRQVEAYNPWIDKSFTKWNCLSLTEYDEVIFIDSDIIVLENMDELFELKAPAACFSSPWQTNLFPYVKTPKGMSRDVFIDLKHKDVIKWRDVLHALDMHGIVGGGFLMKLPVTVTQFNDFKSFLNRTPIYGVEYKCHSGSDEMAICEYFASQKIDWMHIHQRFAAIPWKTDWVNKDIKAYHYLSRKPWDMDPQEWPDLKVWWDVVERMLEVQPSMNELFSPEKVVPLDAESAQYMLINDIRALIMSAWSNHHSLPKSSLRLKIREKIDNVLGKWILSMKELALDNDPSSWSSILCKVKPEDKLNQELIKELTEFGFFKDGERNDLLDKMCVLIDRRLSRVPFKSGIIPQVSDKFLTYGGRFRIPLTERIKSLIDVYGITPITINVIRHFTLNPQKTWSFPQKYIDKLFAWGVRYEGMVSFINSSLWGKDKTFIYDTFPGIDEGQQWMMVLPDHQEICQKVIDKINRNLNYCRGVVFLAIPNTILFASPYLVHSRKLDDVMTYCILSTEKIDFTPVL